MKKKYAIGIVIAVISVLIILCSVLIVLPKKISLTVEVNTEFDLTTLKGYAGYKELKMTYLDKEIKIDDDIVVFENLGIYTITGNGNKYEVTVKDTTAPAVHLMGSIMKAQATDDIELPEVRVVDNYDDKITDYSVSISHGEKDVPVENNTFYAADIGEYVIRLSAKDSSNNKGSNEKTINVTPLFDKRVKAGEKVEVLPEWIAHLLPEGKNVEDYDFSYQIYKNGILLNTKSNEFTAEGNCYYNVRITATSKTDKKEQYSGWIIFVEEHCNILTFTTMTTNEIGAYELICNPYPQVVRSVEAFGDGRFALKMDIDLANVAGTTGKENILLAWPIDVWGLPKGDWGYDASFNLTFKGKLMPNVNTTTFTAGGYSNNVQEFTVNSKNGEFEITEVVSTKEIALFTEGGKSRVYYVLTMEKSDLMDLEVYVDNFQLTPKVAPVFTSETYISKESGEKVSLTVEELGLTATDRLGGTVQSIEIVKTEKFVESTGKRVAFKGDVLSDKGIYFITCLIKDYYGNQAEQEVILSIGMGNVDVKAPVITTDSVDNLVKEGTKITLQDDGIADYLTIKDDSKYTTSYEVRKNGKKINAKSFTVEKYDRYEVYVTATDSSILKNVGRGFIMFMGDGLKDAVSTVNTDKYNVANFGGESHLRLGDTTKAYFYPFKAEIANEGGNGYVKLTPSDVKKGTMEILIPTEKGEKGVVANLDFKVGGTLSGKLSDDTVLFEFGGETVTVADAKNGKWFSVSISNLENRPVTEAGLRTHAIYFEKCANFLAESGLYLCIDNVQREKIFTDLYSGANTFEKLSLKNSGIVIDGEKTALQLVNSDKYELKYEVYKNGSTLVNKTEITRSGFEFYKVIVKVCYKGTNQEVTRFNMAFQWEAESFITMENGEKFYFIQGKGNNPSYHQLLDSSGILAMEMYPFMGEMKQDANNNTYISLKASAIHSGAGFTLVNIKNATEHKADIGFEFWVEGDVSGIPAGTTLVTIGTQEIKVEDIGKKFSYTDRVTFKNCFSDSIRISGYNTLYEKGLKLCVDNVWRNKYVEEQLFTTEYNVINKYNKVKLSETGIIVDNNKQLLQLANSNQYKLSYKVYKNGTEKIDATSFTRYDLDFYSVTVSIINKSNQSLRKEFVLLFVGNVDNFSSMEQDEKFYRIDRAPVFDQLLNTSGTLEVNMYPFKATKEIVEGDTYISLQMSDTNRTGSLQFSNMKDSSSHSANVGFNYWIEGDVSGLNAETVICRIGTHEVKVKDIGKKFYYQEKLSFNGCVSDVVAFTNDSVLKERGLKICLDNVWRKKRVEANITVSSKLHSGDANGIFVTTTPKDNFKGDNTYEQKPIREEGGVYVDGKLNRDCTLVKLADRYYISLADGKVTVKEGTTVVIDGKYQDMNGTEYRVKFDAATFKYINGSWEQNREPDVTVKSTLYDGNATYISVKTTPKDNFKADNTWTQRPIRLEGGVYVDGVLNTGCELIKLADCYYIYLPGGNVTAKEGTTVVFEGIYKDMNGADYRVKFQKATFKFTNGAWVQSVEPDIVVKSTLFEGSANHIAVTTTPKDNFKADNTWMQRPIRVQGGVYVDGVLNTKCTLIKLADRYYIYLKDGKVTATEGMTIVFEGIYKDMNGADYSVKFEKATFKYTNGAWVQI